MYVIKKFDWKTIDRQHPRPPVLTILLEFIEREIFDTLLRTVQLTTKFTKTLVSFGVPRDTS